MTEDTITNEGDVAAPDSDLVNKLLTGAVGLSQVAEAAGILASAETVIEMIEPVGAVLE
jgi:hypothetical protein